MTPALRKPDELNPANMSQRTALRNSTRVQSKGPAGWSLRLRLNLILFMTIALVVFSGTLLVIFNARQSVQDEIASTVHLAVQLIRLEIALGRIEESSPREWFEKLKSLGGTRHLKIDFRPGHEAARNTTESFVAGVSSAPDVPEWFIWAVAPEAMTVSQSITLSDGQPWRFSIEAEPVDEIAEAWSEACDFFILIAGMAAFIFVLVTISVERAFLPVVVILKGLDRIENGEYERRLPEFPLPEFNRIASAINRTALALELARQDNQSLRQHSLAVREQERQYLARELHDEFGQSLSAIKALAVFLKNQALDKAQQSAVDSIRETCNHLFSVLANMLRRLHPLILDELGLKAALEELLETGAAQMPSWNLSFHCDAEVDEFSSAHRIHVFRIVQECLTNILKHAHAKRVSVRITVLRQTGNRRLRIQITDDGVGFDPNAVKSGFGLRSIQERVEGLAGNLSIRTAPGRGLSIDIDIPCLQSPV
ncbi:MAG: sensor histidine kinase [Methylococcales bacterium]